MITGQIIQTSIDELKAITKVDLGVYDLNGSEVASTMEKDDITTDLITGFVASPADSQVIGVHHLLKIRDEGDLLYVLVARGMTDDVYMVGKIAVSQIQNLVIAYKERFDRNNFFQNLLLDNLLLVDIYNRAKKLHVEVSCPRAVYLIETKDEKDGIVSEVLKGMFSPQAGDYVTAVDESSLILIKSVESTTTPETLHCSHDECGGSSGCEGGIWHRGTGIEGRIQVLQGSQDGTGCRQDLLRREKGDRLQHVGNRTSDLSAAGGDLRDVYR